MSVWSQCLLQESYSPYMQLLSLFHDYSLAIISMIMLFVSGLSMSLMTNTLVSNTMIVTMVEVIWTVLPMVILVFLVVPSLKILYLMEESDPFLTLKVIGRQWYWSYELMDLNLEFDSYLDTPLSIGEFRLLDVDHRVVLPIGKNIRGLVTGADVIHSWSLPSLSVKADAVPGRLNQVNLSILRSAILYGQCSEICGANHSFMPITIETMAPQTFMKWCNLLSCVG